MVVETTIRWLDEICKCTTLSGGAVVILGLGRIMLSEDIKQKTIQKVIYQEGKN